MSKNLRVKTSGFIDETYKVSFKFNGITYYGYKGDTLASCLLYTSPSPRDVEESRMPSSA